MKILYMLFWGMLFGLNLMGQVTTITLNSQSQVDSFNINYPEFYGDIQISGEDIVSLDSMYKLHKVSSLSIFLNPILQDICGLNNIDSAAVISINMNKSLEKIAGFNSLLHISNKINISNNDSLNIISGFNQIEEIDRIIISSNMKLKQILGFSSLHRIGTTLSIVNCKELYNASGFANLALIKFLDELPQYGFASLNIQSCDSLPNLLSFTNLTEVESIGIQYCPLIESLEGLQNIESEIQVLGLVSNASLSDITALEAVPFSEDAELIIHDNPNLNFCSISGICGLENPWNQIYNNAPGCDSWYEIDSICSLISVTESAVPGFTLFPNPVKDELTVSLSSNQNDFAISLYSVSGVLIRTYQVKGDTFQLDISDLPGGVYVLFLNNAPVGRFVKRL